MEELEEVSHQECQLCQGSYVIIDAASHAKYAQALFCKCVSKPCKVCGGARFTFQQDSYERETAEPCPLCEVLKQNIRLYNQARIPKKYHNSMLSKEERDIYNEKVYQMFPALARLYRQDKIRRNSLHAYEYVDAPRGLVLMGAPGTGKTHLMAGFAYHCTVELGISCLFQGFSELLSDLRQGYSQGKSDTEIIEPLVNAHVLIIDDLGKGRNTEWELNILDTLISERYNSDRALLITSNYTEDEETTIKEKILTKEKSENELFIHDTIRKRVGERIHSRLKEICYFEELTGPDRRLPLT